MSAQLFPHFPPHLSPEEFVDIADGARSESSVPHLAACERCRHELADFRVTALSLAGAGDVPEPSPFFWTRFQREVNAAVAIEVDRGRGWRGWIRGALRPAVIAPASAVLALGVFLFVMDARHTGTSHGAKRTAAENHSGVADTGYLLRDSLDNDPSLALVSDLMDGVDAGSEDAAVGLMPEGSADHAVRHLDAQDLKELQRLLRLELGT